MAIADGQFGALVMVQLGRIPVPELLLCSTQSATIA